MSQTPNAVIAVLGIDIGESSFHVVTWPGRGPLCQATAVPDRYGSLRRRPSSQSQLRALGHDARLMPAKYVRP